MLRILKALHGTLEDLLVDARGFSEDYVQRAMEYVDIPNPSREWPIP